MSSQKVSPIYEALIRQISKMPENTVAARGALYQKMLLHTQNYPDNQRQHIRGMVKDAIYRIEAEIEEIESANRLSSAIANENMEYNVSVSSLSNETTHHNPSPNNKVSKNKFQISKPALVGISALACFAIVFGYLLLGMSDQTGKVPITDLNIAASEEPSESKAVELQNSDGTEEIVRYDFPANTGSFTVRRGRDLIKPALIDEGEGTILFKSSFSMIANDFLKIDTKKSYIGVVRFKFGRQWTEGEKLPALFVGFRNFGADGKIMTAPASFTAFVHSGRIKPSKLAVDASGFLQSTNLIFPANFGKGTEFPVDAAKFKPFVTLHADDVEIPFELSSFYVIEID